MNRKKTSCSLNTLLLYTNSRKYTHATCDRRQETATGDRRHAATCVHAVRAIYAVQTYFLYTITIYTTLTFIDTCNNKVLQGN